MDYDANASIYQSNSTVLLEDFPVTTFELLGFVCSIGMIMVGIIGVIGNSAAVRYFGRKGAARSTVSVLLTALSTFDLLLLLTGTPIYSLLGIYSFDRRHSTLLALAYCMTVLYPISNFAQMGSVWTMMVISVERYLGVCRPFFARRELTVRRVRLCILVITVISSAYNACRFGEYSINNGLPTPLLRSYPAYVSIYVHWMYFVFVFSLPFFIIVVFNCLVAAGVRHAMLNRPRCQLNVQQRHERKTTLMLLVVVSIFLFCNSLSWPLNAYETFAEEGAADEAVFDFLSDLNNLLVLTHPALNILVYMYFSRTFRNQCFSIFGFRHPDWRAASMMPHLSAYDVRREEVSSRQDLYSHLPLIRTPTTNCSRTPSNLISRRRSRCYNHSSSASLSYLDISSSCSSRNSSLRMKARPQDLEMRDL